MGNPGEGCGRKSYADILKIGIPIRIAAAEGQGTCTPAGRGNELLQSDGQGCGGHSSAGALEPAGASPKGSGTPVGKGDELLESGDQGPPNPTRSPSSAEQNIGNGSEPHDSPIRTVELPTEILHTVLGELDKESLLSARLVSQHFRTACPAFAHVNIQPNFVGSPRFLKRPKELAQTWSLDLVPPCRTSQSSLSDLENHEELLCGDPIILERLTAVTMSMGLYTTESQLALSTALSRAPCLKRLSLKGYHSPLQISHLLCTCTGVDELQYTPCQPIVWTADDIHLALLSHTRVTRLDLTIRNITFWRIFLQAVQLLQLQSLGIHGMSTSPYDHSIGARVDVFNGLAKAISHMKHLTCLQWECRDVDRPNIAELSKLTSLKVLALTGGYFHPSVQGVGAVLSNLLELESFSLYGWVVPPREFSALKNLARLKSLALGHFSKGNNENLDDLTISPTVLERLVLEKIVLSDASDSFFQWLTTSLTRLIGLRVGFERLDEYGLFLDHLASLTNLRDLKVSIHYAYFNCDIHDAAIGPASAFGALTNLERLSLHLAVSCSAEQIETVASLRGLTHLAVLGVPRSDRARLPTLRALTALTGLATLRLGGSWASDNLFEFQREILDSLIQSRHERGLPGPQFRECIEHKGRVLGDWQPFGSGCPTRPHLQSP